VRIDDCPKGCKHETFHYCREGTHCDKHCVCPCRLCVQERTTASADHRLEREAGEN
jgi:hypothetical protein